MPTWTRYGPWIIQYDPPPIPVRSFDWHYEHRDFDGAPDSGDTRYGHAPSLAEAIEAIDDHEADPSG